MSCRVVKWEAPNSSVFTKISKYHKILENEHIDPIIKRVHAHAMVNGRVKYEQNLLNVVGCRVVTRVRRIDSPTDRRKNSSGHDTEVSVIPMADNIYFIQWIITWVRGIWRLGYFDSKLFVYSKYTSLLQDGHIYGNKHRHRNQSTKLGCEARINMKWIVRFPDPEFQVSSFVLTR